MQPLRLELRRQATEVALHCREQGLRLCPPGCEALRLPRT